jgi:hypothetical protein
MTDEEELMLVPRVVLEEDQYAEDHKDPAFYQDFDERN